MKNDTAFQMSASNIRFGQGITCEIGLDLVELGAKRTLLIMDPALSASVVEETVLSSLKSAHIDFQIFRKISIEPTDSSFQKAAAFASEGGFDSIVAVGGGSTIDTAKAANLYSTYPAEFLKYVNAPIGEGSPVPGPLKPLIAIPTTAGTGSETTGVAIFDFVQKKAKTGIAHRYLKPTLGIVDSDNTITQPPMVAASTGLDVLSHALESYTALPFDNRPKPASPLERPAYQGANPISDIWALRALQIVSRFLVRAVTDISDAEARGQMLLASTMAGIGFGNAGVHLPHGMSYPVAGRASEFVMRDYPPEKGLIPHGVSVILNTPAVVRFTASADPGRHLRAAQALGAKVTNIDLGESGEALAQRVIYFIKTLGLPRGLAAVGFTESDIPALVKGTLPQHRVTKLSPIPASKTVLTRLFQESMHIW